MYAGKFALHEFKNIFTFGTGVITGNSDVIACNSGAIAPNSGVNFHRSALTSLKE